MHIPLGILAASGGGAAGAFESIATATGTGSSGTITFSSIPSTYQHLQIRISGRSERNNDLAGTYLRFNSDTGTNYNNHYLQGYYSAGANYVSASGGANTPEIEIGGMPGTTSLSNVYNGMIIDILDYTSTTKNKTIKSFSGYDDNANARSFIELRSGTWRNTNAVTQVTIWSSYNFNSSSTFALYGIKGA